MSDEKVKEGLTNGKENKKSAAGKEPNRSSQWSYHLVVIMLAILCGLVALLIFLPLVAVKISKDAQNLTDYFKWTLSVLLGAFGAWIGAGAAYFFGKENLLESSSSTERAMKIQQESLRRTPIFERIKDMPLTAMNPNFIFEPDRAKKDITGKLGDFKGYWFVPVVEKTTGILKDIIHERAFWNPDFDNPEMKLEEIISKMDEKPELKKLHGDLFYIKVSPNDKISDVYNQVRQTDVEVIIVVDEKGKASYCLSKADLRTFLKLIDNG